MYSSRWKLPEASACSGSLTPTSQMHSRNHTALPGLELGSHTLSFSGLGSRQSASVLPSLPKRCPGEGGWITHGKGGSEEPVSLRRSGTLCKERSLFRAEHTH